MPNAGLCRLWREGAGQRGLGLSDTRHNPDRLSEASALGPYVQSRKQQGPVTRRRDQPPRSTCAFTPAREQRSLINIPVPAFSSSATALLVFLSTPDYAEQRTTLTPTDQHLHHHSRHNPVLGIIPSLRSYHPVGWKRWVQAQCANRLGARCVTLIHHALRRLNPRSRVYFLRAHRIR